MITRSTTRNIEQKRRSGEEEVKQVTEIVPAPEVGLEVAVLPQTKLVSTLRSSRSPPLSHQLHIVATSIPLAITSRLCSLNLSPATKPHWTPTAQTTSLQPVLHSKHHTSLERAIHSVANEVHTLIQSNLPRTADTARRFREYLLDPLDQAFSVVELMALETSFVAITIDLWGCFECLRLRGAAAFIDSARSSDRSRDGTLRHTRFCIDCGRNRTLNNGRVRYQREDVLYVLGKPHAVCYWCERFGAVAELMGREGDKEVEVWTCGECFVGGGLGVKRVGQMHDEQPWGLGF